MERRHRRHRARRAVTQPRRTTSRGSASGCVAMLHEADVHPGEHEVILADLRAGPGGAGARGLRRGARRARRAARPRPRAGGLLELGLGPRARGRRGRARRLVRHAGVVGVGGRTQAAPADLPLPARAEPASIPPTILFVGDTWGPDVEGPLAAGMTPAYLERDGHWPDATRPGTTRQTSQVVRHPRPHAGPAAARTTEAPGIERRDASDDADVLGFFTLPAGTDVELDAPDPLPGCGSPCPGWPRSGRTRRARPHGR